jgi:lipopolysaccharide biosynthesis glycosyltransferase
MLGSSYPVLDLLPPTDSAVFHVAYAADARQVVPMRASILSLVNNTASPRAVVVHLLLLREEDQKFDMRTSAENVLGGCLMNLMAAKGSALQAHSYTAEDVELFINPHLEAKQEALRSPENYVRYLLPTMLPGVDSILWMDADTIVRKDLVSFLKPQKLTQGLGGFPRNEFLIKKKSLQKLTDLGFDLSKKSPSFNAGVLLLNLKFWREHDVVLNVLQLCEWNKKHNLWPQLGSQPPLNLLFGGDRFDHLDKTFYYEGLGNKIPHPDATESVVFLHWNGHGKPWLEGGFRKDYWEPYNRCSQQS